MTHQQLTEPKPSEPFATVQAKQEGEQKIGTVQCDTGSISGVSQERQQEAGREEPQSPEQQQDRSGHALDGRQLSVMLHRAGILDMEVGLLLAKGIAENSAGTNVKPKVIVEQIRRQRPWLFRDGAENLSPGLPGPTAGIHGQDRAGISRLETLARKARQSGSRRDMQQYLRLRRALH